MTTPRLLALSDLHVAHPQNREIVAGLEPGTAGTGSCWPVTWASCTPTSSGRCAP